MANKSINHLAEFAWCLCYRIKAAYKISMNQAYEGDQTLFSNLRNA